MLRIFHAFAPLTRFTTCSAYCNSPTSVRPFIFTVLNNATEGRYTGSISCGIGKQNPRIVGGTEARPEEYPWQVGFRWQRGTGITNIFCGGSLINKNWVVSAAHCFQKPKLGYTLKVALGEFDMWNNDANEVYITAKRVMMKTLVNN